MIHRSKLLFIFFLLLIVPLKAQLLKELEKAVTKSVTETGTDLRVQLDSVDFQFAISLNEGAGFFDVEQKGETGSKLLYSAKAEEDKSTVEKARDTLELGIGMYNIRRYEMAEIAIRGTKLLMESSNLTNEIVYLRVLSNLGLICLTQGKTAEAEIHIREALSMSEMTLGMNSAAYVANLNNYAKLHQIQGKYNEAEKGFDQCLQLSEEVFGEGMQKAIILNNKAMLYQTLGQYEIAVKTMQQSIEVSTLAPKKALQGKKSFDNRKFKANLAMLYQKSGRFDEANALFRELKKIFENRRQTKNAEYAGLMNQLGILYIQMDRFDQVRDPLVTALNVYKKRWGEENIYFAKTGNDLGNFNRMSGNMEGAKLWLNKSFEVRRKLLQPTHPDYIKSQEDLAIYYWKFGDYAKAYELYKEVMEKTIDVVNRFFPPMSEAEKTQFWDITSPRFQRFYNFALESHTSNPDILGDVFNYNMATKGLLLSTTSKVKNSIMASGDQQLIAEYLTWQDQKEQLARLYSYSKSKLKSQNINLDELERQANQMEKQLSERSNQFSQAFKQEKNDYKLLKTKLGPNEAIVDLIRIQHFDQDFTDEVKYLALILKQHSSGPEFVVVENGQELELNRAKFYRNAIHYNIDDASSFNYFWASIEEQISNEKKIYFSPDGVYNQININTLLMPDGDFIVNRHDLVLMGNSKDLAAIKNRGKSSSQKNAFLLGYPDYGNPDISLLPGTRDEVNNISRILKSGGYKVAQYMEGNATETQVKKINGPRIVHIATHGYFKQDVKGGSSSLFGVSADNAANNPLLRSGLILAGTGNALADTTAADISSNDNGILTAYEVLNLNLDNTDLVVLSACETGLGEIKSGEGVYGLQRAFQVAGADALIMSLWKVSDAATQQLMTNFYTNWVKMGDKQTAFRQAQLQLMKEYKEPYFWGAFVMIGG